MSAPATMPNAPDRKRVVQPLQSGDRLTAEEFERRYDAMPDLKKAELIEGVVYVASPVSADFHGEPHFDLIGWLSIYRVAAMGIRAGDNTTIRLDLKNRPQPDAYLRLLPEFGGQASVSEDDYIVGAVELAAEVSSSSVSYDLHDKLTAYQRNGIREYVVWRVEDGEIDWFVLRGGKYERVPMGADGIIRSEVFPGLWLDPAALVRRDMKRVDEVARMGLVSPDYAAFAALLKQRIDSASSGAH